MFRSVDSVVGLVNLEAYTTNTLLPDVGVDGNCTAHSVDDGVKSVSNSKGTSVYTVVVEGPFDAIAVELEMDHTVNEDENAKKIHQMKRHGSQNRTDDETHL